MPTTETLVKAGMWPYAAEEIAQTPIYLVGSWTDIGTAESAWLVSPIAGTISNWWTVLHGAITGADETCTLELGGTLVTGSSITVANSGSAAGTVDTAAPTAANTVAAGGAIEVITAGSSTGATKATFIIEITPTGA